MCGTIVSVTKVVIGVYISSKSVQLLQTAFLHIDVTSSASVNPISGGTSCTYVNHSLHRSFRQTNHCHSRDRTVWLTASLTPAI